MDTSDHFIPLNFYIFGIKLIIKMKLVSSQTGSGDLKRCSLWTCLVTLALISHTGGALPPPCPLPDRNVWDTFCMMPILSLTMTLRQGMLCPPLLLTCSRFSPAAHCLFPAPTCAPPCPLPGKNAWGMSYIMLP